TMALSDGTGGAPAAPPFTCRQTWVWSPPSLDSKSCNGNPALPLALPMNMESKRLMVPPFPYLVVGRRDFSPSVYYLALPPFLLAAGFLLTVSREAGHAARGAAIKPGSPLGGKAHRPRHPSSLAERSVAEEPNPGGGRRGD